MQRLEFFFSGGHDASKRRDALQLPLERPLYGNEAPEPVGSELAQTAMGRYLNNRAATIFGGSDEVQKNIIAKTVLGL